MSVFIPRVGSGDLVFPICLQNLYTLCMQVLMKRKGRGEKNGKERERERRKEGVSLSPVFYTFITCLALVILAHELSPSQIKNTLRT